MKKILLALPLVFALSSNGLAQDYLGARTAYSFSKIKYDGDQDDDYNGRVSFGVTYNHRIRFFNVGAELNLENRGAKTSYVDYTYGPVTEKLNFSYLTLPVKVGVVIGKKISAIANVGIVPGYLLSAKDKVSFGISKQSLSQSITSSVSKFDLSALAELGIGYKIVPMVSVYSTFRFQSGLTKLTFDQSSVDFTHRNMIINIGAQVAL